MSLTECEGKLKCVGTAANSDHASASAAVPTHFNLPSHSVKDMLLIPLELQVTNNPSRRKAREAYFIQRGQTLTPYDINRRNER